MSALTYNPPVFTTPPATPLSAKFAPTTPLMPAFSSTFFEDRAPIEVETRQPPERKPFVTTTTVRTEAAGMTVVSTRTQAVCDYSRALMESGLSDDTKQIMLSAVMSQLEDAKTVETASAEQKIELRKRVEEYHRGIDVEAKRALLVERGLERAPKFKPGFKFMTSDQRAERRGRREAVFEPLNVDGDWVNAEPEPTLTFE